MGPERCLALEVWDWAWVPGFDDAAPHTEEPPDLSRLIPSVFLLSDEPGHDFFGVPLGTESPERQIVGLEWDAPESVRFPMEVWRQESDRLFLEWSNGFEWYSGEFQQDGTGDNWDGLLKEGNDYTFAGAWTGSSVLRFTECPTDSERYQ